MFRFSVLYPLETLISDKDLVQSIKRKKKLLLKVKLTTTLFSLYSATQKRLMV